MEISCLPFRDIYGFWVILGFRLFCFNGTVFKLQWIPYIVFNRRYLRKILQRSDSCLFKCHLHISSQDEGLPPPPIQKIPHNFTVSFFT